MLPDKYICAAKIYAAKQKIQVKTKYKLTSNLIITEVNYNSINFRVKIFVV